MIEDDDVLTAALGTQTENVPEGSEATFEVDLSGGTSTADVEVTYEVDASSTATSGTDYTAPTSWKLTIAAGESSGTITIGTLDNDGVLDPGETLVVKLASATTDTRTVTVDATVTKTATITDSGMVKVSVQDATASEGDSANFAVELGGTVASDVEVSYQTANGTATSGAGKDYTAATGKLTIFAGATGNTIEVTTLEDVIDEANETFTLTLTASNLPTGVSLDDSEATGTITDDDEVSGVPTGVSAQGANTQATLQWSAPAVPVRQPLPVTSTATRAARMIIRRHGRPRADRPPPPSPYPGSPMTSCTRSSCGRSVMRATARPLRLPPLRSGPTRRRGLPAPRPRVWPRTSRWP